MFACKITLMSLLLHVSLFSNNRPPINDLTKSHVSNSSILQYSLFYDLSINYSINNYKEIRTF